MAMVLGANLGGSIVAYVLTLAAAPEARRMVLANLVLRGGGAALILILLGLMIYRHISMGIPFKDGLNQENTEQVETDSI